MGAVIKLVYLLVIVMLVNTFAQQSKKFFRKDYTYLNTTDSFYKIHTLHKTWGEAKKVCEIEGASFFYPEDDEEAREVLEFWKKTQPFSWIYIGVSDLLVKGVYETVDARPILEVYSNWGSGEPNDAGGNEDCVILRRDGSLNDEQCNRKFPFICKKELADLQWSKDCDMPRTDYVYSRELGRCYKFHTDPKSWAEAATVCSAEQSHLADVNSETEIDFLVNLTDQKKKDNVRGVTAEGAVHLGFHNRDGQGWKTVKGEDLEASGYSNWAAGKPDGAGGAQQLCGAMFFNGQLEDLDCNERCFYICEHDISSNHGKIDERFTDA